MTDWQRTAATVLANQRGEFTGEDIRLACRDLGAVAHHPNAWGRFIQGAINDGLIEHTGRYQPPRDRRSHGREIKVYRRVI